MALTDATRRANFSSGVGTDGTLDTNNLNISGVATAATRLKVGSAASLFLVVLLLQHNLLVMVLN